MNSLLGFIDASPTPYHAVATICASLDAAGYKELSEQNEWRVEPGDAYYVVRDGKTVVAWREGKMRADEAGFRILGAHSDSPVLKLRPEPGMPVGETGYLTTEIYGSPLLHTWLDRDLKLAGRVFVRDGAAGVAHRLVELKDTLLRVNSLAPHLAKKPAVNKVEIDRHKDLLVLFSSNNEDVSSQLAAHLASDQSVNAEDILGFDLSLADTLPCQTVGLDNEFVSAPRLDNLFSAYSIVRALLGQENPQDHTNMAVVYDAEEIGSGTWSGAKSNVLESVIERSVWSRGGNNEAVARAKARSIFVSADMAHAEHPSHREATDPVHVPVINEGLAIKTGAKGNYAIGHPAAAFFTMACQDAGVPLQRFMYRCDHGGGASVGPYVSTQSGICGVDVGAPMLAMHSIRELCGAKDIDLTFAAFTAFLTADGWTGA